MPIDLNKPESKNQGPLLPGEDALGENIRTRIERTTQVLRLLKKLQEVAGLNSQLSGIIEFKEKGNEFIKTGKYWEGRIGFVEQRGLFLDVVLSSKKTTECSIHLINPFGKKS